MTIIKLECASEYDLKELWLWRNHPEVRKNFFDEKPVSWSMHKKWFYSRLNDPNTKIYIAKKGKDKIGVIRFEVKRQFIKVSVNLNPLFFGKGFGTEIIKLGTEQFYKDINTKKPVLAKIKRENIASQKAFSKAGYKYEEENKERLVYKKER